MATVGGRAAVGAAGGEAVESRQRDAPLLDQVTDQPVAQQRHVACIQRELVARARTERLAVLNGAAEDVFVLLRPDHCAARRTPARSVGVRVGGADGACALGAHARTARGGCPHLASGTS